MTPSRSARYVALVRALLERPSTPSGDPRAETRLYASLIDERNSFWPFMAARTKFVDDQLLAAMSSGIRQIVILGAGYDGRAMRFRSPGVKFFELDLPTTQRDKRRRLDALDLDAGDCALLAADFTTDSVAELLGSAGHDPRVPTLYICEGVLLYLPRAAVIRVLRTSRACAASGSLLVTTFAIGKPTMGAEIGEQARDRRAEAAEHRQSFYTPTAAHELLRRCGWEPDLVENPDTALAAADDVALFVRASRCRDGASEPGHGDGDRVGGQRT